MLRLCLMLSALTLAACGTGRDAGPTCNALQSFSGIDHAASGALGAPMEAVRGDVAAAMAAPMPRVRGQRSILAISAGGQNGAFSSGFLAGWTERGDRPVFDIVTGASAGALVAPVAFLGEKFDDSLRRNVGIGDNDIFVRRGTLGALLSNSFFDTEPLEARVEELYSQPAFWDALIDQTTRSSRLLLIGATDIGTGRFQRFDFAGDLQADKPTEDKKTCLVEATLASAAIPGLFPPREINGRLFVDAGVRQAIFLDEIVAELDRQRGAGGAEVYLLINGTLSFPDAEVEPTLLPLIGRNLEILTDEGMRASILRVLESARFNGWSLRAAAIEELPDCGDQGSAVFSRCVTEGLFE
ncbi:MAG: patatin-like phospholipase family protein, partial [Pseudomonadota bacterium]